MHRRERIVRNVVELVGVGGIAAGTWMYLSEWAGIAIGAVYLILVANRH